MKEHSLIKIFLEYARTLWSIRAGTGVPPEPRTSTDAPPRGSLTDDPESNARVFLLFIGPLGAALTYMAPPERHRLLQMFHRLVCPVCGAMGVEPHHEACSRGEAKSRKLQTARERVNAASIPQPCRVDGCECRGVAPVNHSRSPGALVCFQCGAALGHEPHNPTCPLSKAKPEKPS